MARNEPNWLIAGLSALLNWMNSPWKILALGFLAPVMVGSAILWDQRVVIVTFYGSPREVEMDIDTRRAPAVLTELLAETGGIAAAVSEWNVELNRRVHVIAVNRQGRELDVNPKIMPIVRSTQLPSIVLPALLAGEVPCLHPIPPPAPAGQPDRVPVDVRRLAVAEGATTFCVSGIPSSRAALLGSLTVLFAEAPQDYSAIAASMRRAARRLLETEVRRAGLD